MIPLEQIGALFNLFNYFPTKSTRQWTPTSQTDGQTDGWLRPTIQSIPTTALRRALHDYQWLGLYSSPILMLKLESHQVIWTRLMLCSFAAYNFDLLASSLLQVHGSPAYYIYTLRTCQLRLFQIGWAIVELRSKRPTTVTTRPTTDW